MSSKGDIHERNLITPNMLQSISLKKGKPIERKKIERDNRIPTKEELEEALHKLKSVRSTDNNETNI